MDVSENPSRKHPARQYKQNRASITDQQKRRDLALARQRNARRDFQDHARRLALGATWQAEQDKAGAATPGWQEPVEARDGAESSAFVPEFANPLVDEDPESAQGGIGSLADGDGTAVGREGAAGGFDAARVPVPRASSSGASDHSLPGDPAGAEPGLKGDLSRDQDLRISELDGRTGTWVQIGRDGRPVTFTGVTESGELMSMDSSHCARPGAGGERMEEGGESWTGEYGSDEGPGSDAKTAQEWYAQQLTSPEWMVDIPPRLQTDWFVLPRPEGRRCLVISSNGTTVSRLRNGRVFHRFPSKLPNGARARNVAAAANVYCILDCVFHEADSTYYVVDVMAWRGYTLYNCAAEFRFFWLQSKLPETPGLLDAPPSHFHKFRFATVPVLPCTSDGLHAAYAGPVPYARDGLLFYNRHAHYTLGLTPLVLAWKDEGCSGYVVDTDASGNVPTEQQIVLVYRADGTVATADTPPVVMGTLPAAFCQSNSKHLRPGLLLKFSVGPGGLNVVDGHLVGADIRYGGPGNQRRGAADSFSKIMFQYAARRDPLTFSQILEAMAASHMSTEEDGSSVSSGDALSDLHMGLEACKSGGQ